MDVLLKSGTPTSSKRYSASKSKSSSLFESVGPSMLPTFAVLLPPPAFAEEDDIKHGKLVLGFDTIADIISLNKKNYCFLQ